MSAVYAIENQYEYNKYIDYVCEDNVAYLTLGKQGRPAFTTELLYDLLKAQLDIIRNIQGQTHIVLSSSHPQVFSLGGDLTLFKSLIAKQDRDGLSVYMKLCIDVLLVANQVEQLEKVAVVAGMAFGGGFEAALSCNYIIAEEFATFGFPEKFFNLFPGMGAYSFLVDRVSPCVAKEMINSGKTYSASELKSMGVIDAVVKKGEGMEAVREYIKQYRRFKNAYNSLRKVYQRHSIATYDDMIAIGEIWVDTALQLSERDIQIIERLERSQKKYST